MEANSSSKKDKKAKNVEKKEPKSYAKRDFLLSIEEEMRKVWEEERLFEANAPAEDEEKPPKYMATFPYPYMNGRLHLGHTFTISKAEFAAAYQRLKGKRALFPFGFHCTGMPIKACADKLKREMAAYGVPPKVPVDAPAEKTEEPEAATPDATQENKPAAADPLAFHSKKAKASAKAGKPKLQWKIMREMGVPEDEIPKFAEAEHWLNYFPPLTKEDLQRMGCGIDWRRSFITTDVNPYYDSFVRWQFETLKDLGKLKFGKRFTVWSPLDGQPCADHDRASGEGVLPQEYTLIKQEVVKPFPEKLRFLESKNVYLVPATLRPETMYGQTNCFVLPEGQYGAFEINDNDVFICSQAAAENLSYQGYSKEFGQTSRLGVFTGQDLIGLPLRAPLAQYPIVYVLPMLNISMNKGTGVVTSVPSDAPDDYAALMDLKNKPKLREKFGVADEHVMPYEVVPIIEIPDFGDQAAVKVCADLGIKSQNDKEKLEKAKEMVYTKGFYEGVMKVGEFSGTKVQDAKPLIRQQLLDSNQAIKYAEPAGAVISRSGDRCVCALTDQWFLDYGEESWRKQAEAALEQLNTYGAEARHQFQKTLEWLNQWACSRTYGLGTRLPWAPQFLIESLSDSTIYMAYYTVAHLLQGGRFDGHEVGPAGIRPEQMTRGVWDYVFLGADYPAGETDVPEETLKTLRREFRYWYPMDLRVSGKDLIPNHLTFCLYNHAAMWPLEMAPRAMRANGHVQLNNDKMSKSTGNFLTLKDAIDKFSADAMRFALADAGDTADDANFAEDNANKAVLRLFMQYEFVKETVQNIDKLPSEPPSGFRDLLFQSEINNAIRLTEMNYEQMKFRDALKTGFYDLQAARDSYRLAVGEARMNAHLMRRFIEVQLIMLAPFCPFYCDHLWRRVLNKPKSILFERWPEAGPIDEMLLQKSAYLSSTMHNFRERLEFMKNVFVDHSGAVIYVGDRFPEWQIKLMEALRDMYRPETNDFAEDYKANLAKLFGRDKNLKKDIKKMMDIAAVIPDRLKIEGTSALHLTIPFDEKEFLMENKEFIRESLGLESLEIYAASDDAAPDVDNKKASAQPAKPAITYIGEKKARTGASKKAAGGKGRQ